MYLALRRLDREIPISQTIRRFALITSAIGTVQYVVIIVFCQKYQEAASALFSKVSRHFLLPAVGETVFGVFMLLTLLLCLSKPMSRLIDEHTGLYWETAFLTHNSATAREKSRMRFRLRVSLVLYAIGIVSNTVTYWLLYTVPAARLFSAAYLLAVSVWFLSLLHSVSQAVREKYAAFPPSDEERTAE